MNEIRCYLRNTKGDVKGVLVGLRPAGSSSFSIGWALRRDGDNYNKELGHRIAVGRAFANHYGDKNNIDTLFSLKLKDCDDLKTTVEKFRNRCVRYFKTEGELTCED